MAHGQGTADPQTPSSVAQVVDPRSALGCGSRRLSGSRCELEGRCDFPATKHLLVTRETSKLDQPAGQPPRGSGRVTVTVRPGSQKMSRLIASGHGSVRSLCSVSGSKESPFDGTATAARCGSSSANSVSRPVGDSARSSWSQERLGRVRASGLYTALRSRRATRGLACPMIPSHTSGLVEASDAVPEPNASRSRTRVGASETERSPTKLDPSFLLLALQRMVAENAVNERSGRDAPMGAAFSVWAPHMAGNMRSSSRSRTRGR